MINQNPSQKKQDDQKEGIAPVDEDKKVEI